MAFSVSLYLVFILAVDCTANIHDRLRYFETLKVKDLSHRVKRSVDPDPHSSSHMTEVEFATLGRKFHLFLKPSKILSPVFKASVIRGNGKTESFNINRGHMLTGHLAGDTSAVANLNYEDDGSMLASIITKEETYVIEPSWRQLPHSDNHTMMAYKKSDVRFEEADHGEHIHSTCGIKEGHGNKDPELHGEIEIEDEGSRFAHTRRKRQSPYLMERTTCHLMVVADYKFFEHMGGKSVAATATYLIHIIQFVNTVYRTTQFDSSSRSMIGVGFEIGEMRIHNESTPITTTLQGRVHYNIKADYWDTKDLLESFSMAKYFSNFCLAHLFTYRQFKDGVLGLAYIASPRRAAVGGICSPMYQKYANTRMTLNTGWSSSQNSGGNKILALQAQLVTSHEFGHNMGSEHDPETDDCAPSERGDGKFVMYPWAVSGYDKNNQMFSPCSKAYIFKVLKVKGYDCFIEGRGDGAFCGNGRIDEGEQCDGGWETKNGADICCDEQCQLRKGKLCSPMNYGCCAENCQPAKKGVVCHPALEGSCLDEIKCDGANISCPNITKFKNDTTPCIDKGVCLRGKCLNFCQLHDSNTTPCICAKESGDACRRCCKPINKNATCGATEDKTLLPNGRPCYQGICNQGVCEKQRHDMVQRLFNIIEDISIDQLVEFMRSNIVGTVIVFSLLLWIPASCVISCVDKRTSKKVKRQRNWLSRSNRTLIPEEEKKQIKFVPHIRVPRHIMASMTPNQNREAGEPMVRWPEDSAPESRQPIQRFPPINPGEIAESKPRPLQPSKFPLSGPQAHYEVAKHRSEGFDIGPDKETVL